LFAYVPQDNVIFSGSIAETLRLIKADATDEELYEALRLACAEDFVRKLPGGIYCELQERGSSLSVGQNQRLAIARAILADAPILLLDEVTAALDLETEEKVLANIAAMKHKTCILSTHRPSVLGLCSHIYKIQETHLVEVDADRKPIR
jgi:ABC-type multidrug transport system fused ATPase/permease subunit